MRWFIRSIRAGALAQLEGVNPELAFNEAVADLRMLADAWRALCDREWAGNTPEATTIRDARELLVKILVGQRVVTQWLLGDEPSVPEWQVEDGHVVVGKVRVPLTADLLETFMKGEMP